MKEVIERLNWLAYKCEDKAITPDVKDDVKYALEEIERLNNNWNKLKNELENILFFDNDTIRYEDLMDIINRIEESDK